MTKPRSPGRLSTCGRCGGTVQQYQSEIYRQLRWRHVALTPDGHTPEPDDSYATTEEES